MYNLIAIIFFIAGFFIDNADKSVSLFFISAIFAVAGAISAVALSLKPEELKRLNKEQSEK